MFRTQPVPPEFFGWIIHRAHTTTAWPSVEFGTWRLWDSYLKWSDIEPAEGQFNFEAFDRQVTLGQQQGKELIYTFGQTPRWASSTPDEKHAWGIGSGAMPRNVDHWRRYVEAVVTRYKGRISAYEVWNEPKYPNALGRCSGSIFFCGTAEQLVQLTKIAHEVVKRIDPKAQLASPGFTDGVRGVSRLDEYLSAGGYKYVEAISFHFYELQPEKAWETIRALRKVMAQHKISNLPVWDSEHGFLVQNQKGSVVSQHELGPFSRVFSPDAAASRMVRAHLVAAAGGVDRVIWYAWDDFLMGAIGTDDGRPTAVAHAYRVLRTWLLGSTIACADDPDAPLVQCELSRNRRAAKVYWARQGDSGRSFTIPVPVAGRIETLRDGIRTPAGASEHTWDGEPLLMTVDSKPWKE